MVFIISTPKKFQMPILLFEIAFTSHHLNENLENHAMFVLMRHCYSAQSALLRISNVCQ